MKRPETRELEETNPSLRSARASDSGIYNHESSIVWRLAPGPHDIIALDSPFGPLLAGRAIVTSRSAHVLIVDTRRLPLPSAAVPCCRSLPPTSSLPGVTDPRAGRPRALLPPPCCSSAPLPVPLPRGFKMENFDASLSTYFKALLGPRDARVKGWFLLDNYIPTFICSVIYLLIVWLGPKYMKNRQPFSCRGILVVYNLGLTLLSLYMFCELVTGVWEGKYNFFCQGTRSGGEADMKIIHVLWWYYFSKLIEFMDTFFFILRKNNHQITVLHVYHHATMLNIWWFVMNWVPCGHSYFGATLNSFIHVLMYSYYGLSSVPSMRPYLWWKKYITQGQLLQFVLTIIQTTCGVIWPCAFPLGWLYFQIGYMISLITLFTNFYIQTYNKKGASRRKDHLKDHQNGSVAAVNGHTNSFSSLENSVKPRKQRKD
ncbi:very long chain fatty acid elongase 5 [Dasypus novemcinctus]|uniref:very long chain fatty acid elongase 5 n=1 Tax=Dasypus novemcinctus TaxID=9361 RepID=UPI0026600B6A|nr:elongation of very long chain fatty acids protein 5 [Dasypus novemcinctus]